MISLKHSGAENMKKEHIMIAEGFKAAHASVISPQEHFIWMDCVIRVANALHDNNKSRFAALERERFVNLTGFYDEFVAPE
jgi:hypothetical protein